MAPGELRGRSCARLVGQAMNRLPPVSIPPRSMRTSGEAYPGPARVRIRRDEMFVTTKVWPTHFSRRNDLERSTKESLVRLRIAPTSTCCCCTGPISHVPLAETLGGECQGKLGPLARHIGVSGTFDRRLDRLEAVKAWAWNLWCADQVEYHPYLDQTQGEGGPARATAWRWPPIVLGSHEARSKERCGAFFARSAKPHAHVRGACSACAGWCSRTSRRSRAPRASNVVVENIDIFDFELSEEEMGQIYAMENAKGRLDDYGFAPKWD